MQCKSYDRFENDDDCIYSFQIKFLHIFFLRFRIAKIFDIILCGIVSKILDENVDIIFLGSTWDQEAGF